MEMLGNRGLGVTQQQAWEALNDPETLKKCIPGCDKFELTGDEPVCGGAGASRSGPCRPSSAARSRSTDIKPPRQLQAVLRRAGRRGRFRQGRVERVAHAADGAGCELDYTVQAQVGGKIAQMGQRLIDGVAKSMADDFFKRFDAEMQSRYGAAAAEAAQPKRRPRRPAPWPASCRSSAWVKSAGVSATALERLEALSGTTWKTSTSWCCARCATGALAGRRALLSTVVRTWGSSPRPIGSIMALAEDGAVVGSVSGGCIEDDLIARYSRAPAATAHARGRAGLRQVRHHRRRGAPLRPALRRHAGTAARIRPRRRRRSTTLVARAGAGAADAAHGAAGRRRGRRWPKRRRRPSCASTTTELVNTFGPEYRMLLIGAGQLTEYLATMAHVQRLRRDACAIRATEYRTRLDACPASTITTEMPDDAVTGVQARPAQLRGGAHARPQARRPGAAGGAEDRGLLRRRDRHRAATTRRGASG